MVHIKIMELSFNYNSVKALQDVTFEVKEGEVVSILGPNGSGKTTLLKCICRILKPTYGAIYIDGRDISKLSLNDLAKTIGYVPQIEEKRFPLTVFEFVLLGRKPHMGWMPSDDDLKIVSEVLNDLNLSELAFRRVDELSGGEFRKVVIARALAQEPKVLLLDEPTNHLDLKHQIEVLGTVKKLANIRKLCVIMAIHDVNLALRFSNKIIVLRRGKIVFCGDPLELEPKVIEDVYQIKVDVVYSRDGYPVIIPLA